MAGIGQMESWVKSQSACQFKSGSSDRKWKIQNKPRDGSAGLSLILYTLYISFLDWENTMIESVI